VSESVVKYMSWNNKEEIKTGCVDRKTLTPVTLGSVAVRGGKQG